MLVARNWILHNKKILKTVGRFADCYKKKIVRDPYVFAGPMPSALPIPPPSIVVIFMCLLAFGSFGSFGSLF
jgi:hypothetical protein